MAVPYNSTIASYLDGHTYVKKDGSWQIAEDIQVKHSGAWRDTKAVYVKTSGTWRIVHDGEHFLFNYTQTGNDASEFNLASYISGQGYGGNLIKGCVQINAKRQRVNLGSFSTNSKVYLGVATYGSIKGRGGNGGNRGGQNGSGGQTSLYSGGTPFIINNAGVIAGGGGGGGGGINGQCVYQNTYTYGCMKGSQCQGVDQQFSNQNGGGGGGGAGYPGGTGVHGGQNGQETGGGGGGGNGGCGAQSGGKGGNLGQNGQNATNGGNGAGHGTGIQGINHRYQQVGSGDGDIRGGTSNT